MMDNENNAVAREELRRKILDSLSVTLPRRRPSLIYLFGLFVVAIAMVILPLVYLALICLVAYGVYWHAVAHADLMAGQESLWRALLYIGPIVVGVVLIIFMFSSLFAAKGDRTKRRIVPKKKEPFLYAFVAKVARAVGAPVPRQILINAEVSAAAGPRHGLFSIFRRDLVLHIGTPLVSGMSLMDFAGVLAHELGHFSQGMGMTFSWVIQTINGWFARVVCQRAPWDRHLAGGCDSADRGLIMAVNFLLACMRKILWVFLHVGHGISCFMLRQMEYDADRCWARFSGSDRFAGVMHGLEKLSVAGDAAMADLQELWQKKQLPDDLTRLIMAKLDNMPEDVTQKIERKLARERTGTFDTHPVVRDRIAQVEGLDEPGFFTWEEPARILFNAFDEASKVVTKDLYKGLLGADLRLAELKPVDFILYEQQQMEAAYRAMARYSQNMLDAPHPFMFVATPFSAPEKPAQAIKTVKASRERLLAKLAAYRKACKAFNSLDGRIMELFALDALCESKVPLRPAEHGLKSASRREVHGQLTEVQEKRASVEERLERFEGLMAHRIRGAMQLFLHVPEVVQKLAGGDALKERVEGALAAIQSVEPLLGNLLEIRNEHHAVNVLLNALGSNTDNAKLQTVTQYRISRQVTRITELKGNLTDDVMFPFSHGREAVTVKKYLVPRVPDKKDYNGSFQATEELLDKGFKLYFDCFSVIALAAEKVEERLGLKPLPEPKQR